MAVVVLSQGYWRMLTKAPESVRHAVAEFLLQLEQLPDGTPFPGDSSRPVPPTGQWMCHVFPGSTWMLYYSVGAERIVVRTVTTG